MAILTVLFRWFSGRPMDGIPRTDSSFLYRGTRSMRGYVTHPSRWSMLAGWQRCIWRNGILDGWIFLVYMWLYHRVILVVAGVTVFLLFAGLTTLVQAKRWPDRQHMKRIVKPLHIALCSALDIPEKSSLAYLNVPRSIYTDPDNAHARVSLPKDFEPIDGNKLYLEQIISGKLALEDPEFSWKTAGKMPMLIIRQSPQPPEIVKFESVADLLLAATDARPLLGKGIRDSNVYLDFDDESPHVAFSYGAGGGKSFTTKLVTMQILACGGIVVILDIKRTSHLWARGLPGVVYCRYPQEIHNAWVALGIHAEERFDYTDKHGEVVANQLPRIGILAEELNMCTPKLKRFWEINRRKGDPKMSPAIEALGDIGYAGRSVRMNALFVSQYLTALTVGNPAVRENCATRVLGRYTTNANMMLCPQVKLPPTSKIRGRVQVVQGDEAKATQVIHVSDGEAREFVLAGQKRRGVEYPKGLVNVAELLTLENVPQIPTGYPVYDPGQHSAITDGITLRDYVDNDEKALVAIRRASTRDPEFPAKNGKRGAADTYNPDELDLWQRNRIRAIKS